MNTFLSRSVALMVILMWGHLAIAQNAEDDIYDMSLEELMDIEIVSASKKAETLFEAPLASYTITRDEIRNAGSLSIPEALKLCPGVIVREHTNGAYEVHLRGLDNMVRYDKGGEHFNKITLVMVDNRPVFNHINGMIFWEALPVSINDVERVEIVKGPSSPLFGPNAVAGVINIITLQPEKEGLSTAGNMQYGNFNSLVGGINAGFNKKGFSFMASGNIDHRDRSDNQYFQYSQVVPGENVFVNSPADLRNIIMTPFGPFNDSIDNVDKVYENPAMAIRKQGINGFAKYEFNEQLSIQLQGGYQNAEVQNYFFDNEFTPLAISEYKSTYLNSVIDWHDLKVRYSHTAGHDNMQKYDVGGTSAAYDYRVNELFIDYTWNIRDKLLIQPAFNLQNALYGIYEPLNTTAGALRLDYAPLERLRLIAATRLDHFSNPGDTYLSYQFASTLQLNEQNLIRGVVSRSTSGAFIAPVLLDIFVEFDSPFGPLAPKGLVNLQGNQNLELFTLDLIEVGYRARLANNIDINVELFRQKGTNFYAKITKSLPAAPQPPFVYDPLLSQNTEYQNLPLVAIQNGISISANWVVGNDFQLKPFVTYQKTMAESMPSGLNEPDYDDVNNIVNTHNAEHKSTPNWFGGLYLNWSPSNRFNINVNPYFMSGQTIYQFNDQVNNTDIGSIDANVMVNAKVSFAVVDGLNIFANIRNLSTSQNRQYYGTDVIKPLVLGGIDFNF